MKRNEKRIKASAAALAVVASNTEVCVFRHVSRTARSVSAFFDTALAPTGLSAHQFNLMMTLKAHGPATVGDLARLVGMDSTSVPRAVKPLERRGWLTVATGKDRRQRILHLSAEGEARIVAAVPTWAKAQQTITDVFGEERWSAFMGELAELRGATRRPTL